MWGNIACPSWWREFEGQARIRKAFATLGYIPGGVAAQMLLVPAATDHKLLGVWDRVSSSTVSLLHSDEITRLPAYILRSSVTCVIQS